MKLFIPLRILSKGELLNIQAFVQTLAQSDKILLTSKILLNFTRNVEYKKVRKRKEEILRKKRKNNSRKFKYVT